MQFLTAETLQCVWEVQIDFPTIQFLSHPNNTDRYIRFRDGDDKMYLNGSIRDVMIQGHAIVKFIEAVTDVTFSHIYESDSRGKRIYRRE